MSTLGRSLRRELERAVSEARRLAHAGAEQALSQLAVAEPEAWTTLSDEQKALRRRLRAHARQLGDRLTGERPRCDRLVAECAYEHWHRLLFARFLAENDLLIEPESGVALALTEVRELARERGRDWIALASEFAQSMLPQIFRPDDPVLAVALPPEARQALEHILTQLQREVFLADDSLGWVYQYWQKEEKERVDRELKSGRKAGAAELPAKTQLFTEDYMVLFLLENTLGAWWASRVLDANPEIAATAADEAALRKATSPPGYTWTYLRFVRDEGGAWRAAAGDFSGWPHRAAELRVLDPCMGSGHFLVFALPILAAFRRAEEGLSPADASVAVLRDNLFGLELDARCTQLAAFNLALAAWRSTGHQELPPLQLACSGLGVNASEEDWKALGGDDRNLRIALGWLYPLFRDAATLGSLVNPAKSDAAKIVKWGDLLDALRRAVAREVSDEEHELGVRAFGVAQAAEILASRFTLVATNVPYLKRGNQVALLRDYSERAHPVAKANLASAMLERCLDFSPRGTVAIVVMNELFSLGSYTKLRRSLLQNVQWELFGRLGAGAFGEVSGEVVNVSLVILSSHAPRSARFFGLDVSDEETPVLKSGALVQKKLSALDQGAQSRNPDSRIVLDESAQEHPLLSEVAIPGKGSTTGDSDHYHRCFWELPAFPTGGVPWLDTATSSELWSGRHLVSIEAVTSARMLSEGGCMIRGQAVWGKPGVAISKTGKLRPFSYAGEIFDDNVGVLSPKRPDLLAAIFAFLASDSYSARIRAIDQTLKITAATLAKVPFDLAHWQRVAAEKYPHGLPKPHSDDPTQWLFSGHPAGAEHPLQVAVARLLGYRWPRQKGSSFSDCPALGADGLEGVADEDGIVCLAPLRGERPATERLRALLAAAYGEAWSPEALAEALAREGSRSASLETWLRDEFFEQHCALFHQRPFVWHLWDGQPNGFGALVSYHKLAAPNGEGRRTLEKVIYSYLGDWIDRQRDEQNRDMAGADARLAAAEHLKGELEKILAGEPPYDLFVRWKPLHAQPIGWEPDLDDGVRVNIRPFMTARPLGARARNACILRATPNNIRWDKDRGTEPSRPREDFPWFWSWDESDDPDFAGGERFDGKRWNNLHYTSAAKRAARERNGRGGQR